MLSQGEPHDAAISFDTTASCMRLLWHSMGFLYRPTSATVQMLKVRWFSQPWHKITPMAEDHGTWPTSRGKPTVIVNRPVSDSPAVFSLARRQISLAFLAEREKGAWENFGETRGGVGWEKMALWSTKAAISLKRVQIEEKLVWGAWKSPSLFRTVPSPTPYGLPFPKIGGSHPPKTPIAIISGVG